eukprot:187443-Ditylum_brightwellii.AAC.1
MVHHNSTLEEEDEQAEVGEGGKPEENEQDMMEEDKKKGEKQKLAVDAKNNGTKGAEIKATTSAKDTMRARGENMVETKTIYKSKLRMGFNVKEGVKHFNIRGKVLKVLNRLHLVNQELYVKDGKEKWKDDEAFPSGK